jgi:hypothetical protein
VWGLGGLAEMWQGTEGENSSGEPLGDGLGREEVTGGQELGLRPGDPGSRERPEPGRSQGGELLDLSGKKKKKELSHKPDPENCRCHLLRTY